MQIGFLRTCLILTLLSASALSQQVIPPDKHLVTPEGLISTAISSGGWDGHMQKQFGVLGDAAAVMITKVVSERRLSAVEIDSVLAILRISFTDPSFVEAAADREPRTALFVLRHLDLLSQDSSTKKKVVDTRAYIEQQYAKYTEMMNAKGTVKPH